MSGKKRGPKPRYEEEDVLEAMAVYFYEHMVVRKEDLSVFTMDAIYDDIQHDASQSILYRNVAFPKYSRMRKMLIDHLSAYGLYQEKERLNAAVASRIIETYEIDAEKNVFTSANFLSELMFEKAGMKLLPYQEFLKSVREEIPAMDGSSWRDADGNWEVLDTSQPILEEYWRLQYRNMFDKKIHY